MNSERLAPEHPNGIKLVQVGCGPQHIRKQWWNIDIRPFTGIDEAMDATMPWRWSNQLELIYAEHFLEHLTLERGVAFLVNAGNALKVGGKIRLSTPSLEWVLSTHFNVNEVDPQRAINQTIAFNRAFYGWGHQFLYSRAMLLHLLRSLNYENPTFYDYGVSEDPRLNALELHGGWDKSGVFPSVWIVEGTRGDLRTEQPDDLKAFIDHEFGRHVRSGH